MMQRTVQILLVVLLTTLVAYPKEKNRNWQTGKVLDSDRDSKYAGSVGNISSYGTATATAVYRVYQTYAIEVGDYIYVARERLKWRWSKPADLTVNGPVKVAIEKNKLYLLAEDSKEHQAEIVKKILKQKEEQK